MFVSIPDSVAPVLALLERGGFEAYVVGGCVRDSLLHRTPKDWDICTNATPEQMFTCFQALRVIPTGLAHGTVTVLSDSQPIEVTTFRVDGPYSDNRHPDSVCFTASLIDDLARRDFTVNAMAYHPDRGLIDPFGGEQDLKDGVIRCVGDPKHRFEEDALRVLRALRFASVLGFSIEPQTAAAAKEAAPLLANIAVERIASELTQLVCGDHADAVLTEFWPVLATVLPFTGARAPHAVLSQLPPEPAVRYAALYHACDDVKSAMLRLRSSKQLAARTAILQQAAARPVPASLADTRRLVGEIGEEAAHDVLLLMSAFGSKTEQAQGWLTQIADGHLCCRVADLAVSGDDLRGLGISGRKTGAVLKGLLQAVIEEQIQNQPAALLAYAARMQTNQSKGGKTT